MRAGERGGLGLGGPNIQALAVEAPGVYFREANVTVLRVANWFRQWFDTFVGGHLSWPSNCSFLCAMD